jgi:spermidine synthase
MGLWALSGFCTLTLETAWMRVIALWAGHTVVASTLVIVVFFAAAAVGNLLGARLVAGAARPLGYYGRFEVAAGMAAAVAFAASQWLWRHLGALPAGWSGQLPAAILLVGLPSLLSGAAFPSLAETFVPAARARTARGAPFYGLNLLGAALGVAAGGVLLPWQLGVRGAVTVAALLQIVGGLVAWRMAGRVEKTAPAKVRREVEGETVGPAWLGWALLAASGVFSLATQALLIVWVRQVLMGSVYSVCGALGAFIGGLGLGALAAAFFRRRGHRPMDLLAVFAGCSAALLFVVPMVGAGLVRRSWELSADSPLGMIAEALGWCALGLLPLAFCLGGVFPVAWELVESRTAHEGRVLGTALALNKAGSAVGAVTGLFVLLPWLGLERATLLLAWAYLAVSILPMLVSGRPKASRVAIFIAVMALGVWQSVRSQPVLGLTAASRSIAEYAGAYGPVSVIEDRATDSRQILLNSRQRLSGTGNALSSQRHQSWAPLLFCPHPDRVLTIGMAAGVSAAAALDFPIRELHSIELVPEVVRAAREHFPEWNSALFTDPRSRVMVGDGRVTLARLPGNFDAIVCDLFFPSEEGSAYLYSREFLQNARSRLNRGGVFCLWLPCYQHTPQTAGSIIRTFLDAFPNAIALRSGFDPLQPVIGLLGSSEPLPISREYLATQLATSAVRNLASRSPFFQSPDNALLLFAGDLRAADPSFAGYPLTTDDHPLLAWLGPRLPRTGERLIGFPFLDWIGKRYLRPHYPSCDLGTTSPDQILNAVRAGNFYFAAAAAKAVVPGDPRPEQVRLSQVAGYLQKARTLSPNARVSDDMLGQ